MKTFSDKVNEKLDSGAAIYLWLCIAIAFTTPVNAEIGRLISRLTWAQEGGKFIHGLTFAIIIEVGIFILAAIGEKGYAKFVMFYSICAHILFFHMWDEFIELNYGTYTQGTLEYYLKFSMAAVKLLSSIGVSFIAPMLIFFFSEKIAGKREFQSQSDLLADLSDKLATIKMDKAETERHLSEMKQEVAKLERNKAAISEDYMELQTASAELKREVLSLKNTKNALGRRSVSEIIHGHGNGHLNGHNKEEEI